MAVQIINDGEIRGSSMDTDINVNFQRQPRYSIDEYTSIWILVYTKGGPNANRTDPVDIAYADVWENVYNKTVALLNGRSFDVAITQDPNFVAKFDLICNELYVVEKAREAVKLAGVGALNNRPSKEDELLNVISDLKDINYNLKKKYKKLKKELKAIGKVKKENKVKANKQKALTDPYLSLYKSMVDDNDHEHILAVPTKHSSKKEEDDGDSWTIGNKIAAASVGIGAVALGLKMYDVIRDRQKKNEEDTFTYTARATAPKVIENAVTSNISGLGMFNPFGKFLS